ncbi:MAG: alanine racemase [Gammaproteobacteria bacterium]
MLPSRERDSRNDGRRDLRRHRHARRHRLAQHAFGVARLGEGVELRAAGLTKPIVLMEGVFSSAEIAHALRYELDLVVHDETQVVMLEERARTAGAGADAPRVVWLKLDTGMSRLGFAPDRARNAAERLRTLPMVGDLRVMTHFACADEPDSSMTIEQIARFDSVIKEINSLSSTHGARVSCDSGLANSAAILQWPVAHREWVRAGIALYGSSPILGRSAESLGLKPVMTLSSRVIALRELAPGQAVGYGASWRASRRSRVATVAAGYADGLLRSLPSGAPVLVAGRRASLVGRVSMDMITVDVTDLDDVQVGSEVVLWGEGLPVDEVAAAAGTISYELLCAVTRRVAFEYF